MDLSQRYVYILIKEFKGNGVETEGGCIGPEYYLCL